MRRRKQALIAVAVCVAFVVIAFYIAFKKAEHDFNACLDKGYDPGYCMTGGK